MVRVDLHWSQGKSERCAKPDRRSINLTYALTKPVILGALLDAGANVDAATKNSWSAPLLCAIANNLIGASKISLEHKANPNAGADNNRSALVLAVGHDSAETVKTLPRAWAEVDITDAAGWTPLERAVAANQNELVKLLLENNAEPNGRIKTYHSSLSPGGGDAGIGGAQFKDVTAIVHGSHQWPKGNGQIIDRAPGRRERERRRRGHSAHYCGAFDSWKSTGRGHRGCLLPASPADLYSWPTCRSVPQDPNLEICREIAWTLRDCCWTTGRM